MNMLATIGHNNPPVTPFDLSREEIEGLFIEAKNWCDGTPIASEEQAAEVAKLQAKIRAAEKLADDRRAAENKPFDQGKAEVQARYAPLIADTKSTKGKTVLAMDACKKALTAWLLKVEAEQREAARLAREEAERKEAAAQAAFRAANPTNLDERETAETLATEAKAAEAEAKKADTAKAHAKADGFRAVGLRTYYEAEITDLTAFARFCWTGHLAELRPAFQSIADRLVAAKVGGIPGVTVHERKRV